MAAFTIKDPDAPATEPQKGAVAAMMGKLTADQLAAVGLPTIPVAEWTKGQASAAITALGAAIDGAKPKQSLAALAAQLDSKAIQASTGVQAFPLTSAEVTMVLGWAGVADMELGLEADEEALADRLRAFLKAPAEQQAAPTLAKHAVPDGHYAVGDEGAVKFFRIQNGKDKSANGGKDWTGWVFIDQQAGDDFHPVKTKALKDAIVAQIVKDGVLEAAKRYGTELGVCGVCHKTLTDPASIAKGIGPVCEANLTGAVA